MPKTNTLETAPSLNEDTLQDVTSASEATYSTIATEKDVAAEQVHRMRVCHRAADLMVENMLGGHHKVRKETSNGSWVVDSHSYNILDVPIQDEEPKEVLLDATWQQFLPEELQTPDLPKVLVGTREEFISQLQQYGITDPFTLAIWNAPKQPSQELPTAA